jgi:prepilin-type N-terminal cleavage/methylation domain-containing protein
MRRRLCKNWQKGFTIVELMIAASVFSVIMLMATMGVLQVSHTYYKGVTEMDTQSTAREIIDTISQAIQFGGTVEATGVSVPGANAAFCVGDQQFNYRLGWQVVDDTTFDPVVHETPHGLYVKKSATNCANAAPLNLSLAVPSPVAAGDRELLAPRMRLSALEVVPLANDLYSVHVRVAYGDDDLLSNPTLSSAQCRLNISAGMEFCAVSDLSTVVKKRISSEE